MIHAFDRQTDGQTEFSLLDCVCIPCSTVKTTKLVHLQVIVVRKATVTGHCGGSSSISSSSKLRRLISYMYALQMEAAYFLA